MNEPVKLAMRLYQCAACDSYSYHATNHRGTIYPWCGVICDTTEPHEYIEDVNVIIVSDDLSIADRMKVQPALGRIEAIDMGRRVYVTATLGPQAESLAQLKRRQDNDRSN